MITRSNLAEQLREYQMRSKHEWATLSFFSSTATNTSSWLQKVAYQNSLEMTETTDVRAISETTRMISRAKGFSNGCGGRNTCGMGAVYVGLPNFLGGCFVFPVHEGCFGLNLSHFSYVFVHQSNKASKKKQEDEEKNASTIINVKL
ncbi:hypothetical protein ZIOFF_046237 [Zingiber officinale]|uniref:Uncharacterized protein n=1 Tax=Zingiber officinale TaxID=94328 RepID=A0A8J5L2D8_ZINOF|nr:hypothetical protein ZIOFF_046237 [Zingiber officinale]